MWSVRGITLIAAAILGGCQTRSPTYHIPPSSPTDIHKPSIDTDKVEKKRLSMDLPEPPANGARAFFGLKIRDCKKGDRTGAYVAGYFFMYEKSPARDGGMTVGDEIVEINDNRVGINADELEKYITKVAVNVMYKFKVIRQGQVKSFEIRSLQRFIGNPVLSQTTTASCQLMGLSEL